MVKTSLGPALADLVSLGKHALLHLVGASADKIKKKEVMRDDN